MKRHLAIAVVLLAAAMLCQIGYAGQVDEPWLRAAAFAEREAVPQGGAVRVAVVLDIDAGYHLNANPPAPKYLIPVTVAPEAAAAVRWGAVRYPAGKTFSPKWAEGETVSVYERRAIVVAEATAADDTPPGPATLRLKLDFQGCSETACFQPSSRELAVTVRIVEKGAAPVPANPAIFFEADRAFSAQPGTGIRFEDETNLSATFEKGFAFYLGSLILFGLLLNLTPCVFPLIPVTMTVFAQQGESRAAKTLPLAVLYVLGLATAFTAVGIAASLAGRSMGLVLQEPFGVLGVVAVLAVVMASALGAFDIRLPSGAMGRLGARRGMAGSLFTGMVMGLVASPCVGPFMIALITFVATKGSVALGAVSFFATGLGLGLPYIFLGMFTGLINRFPRGGGWLIWTKRVMGMALAGLILYYARPFIVEAFFWPLVLATFVFAGAYLGLLEGLSRRPFSRTFRAVRLATGAAIVAAGVLAYADATAARPQVEWTPWHEGALEAARGAGKPAILYFGADWCIACKEWHASIFSNPEVVKESAGFVRIYADVTKPPQGTLKDFAERYEAVNPPVVVIFGRDGRPLHAWRNPPDAAAFAGAMREAAAPRH
jgi:thiol:disulfide interchange protein DsbD